MKRIAIMTATSYGQTAKIAKTLKAQFEAAGIQADLLSPSDALGDVDAVVIGCPVYIGKFSSEVIDWARKNLGALNEMPSAFFSVSLNAADGRAKARIADNQLLQSFLLESGLDARFLASFAGMIHYTKYGWFKRWMMKRIAASAGGPTDTSKDHELTDWSQVKAFAHAFVEQDFDSPFAAKRRLEGVPVTVHAPAGAESGAAVAK